MVFTTGSIHIRYPLSKLKPSIPGGKPFTVRWDSSTAGEGFYKLVVKGYFLGTGDSIEQTVLFYHQPVVD